MKVAAITRFKHGELFQLMKKYKWTNVELSRRSGVPHHKIGHILNMTHRPSEDVINKIQIAFAEVGEFIDVQVMFPDYYVGFANSPRVIQIKDVSEQELSRLQYHEQNLLEDAQPPLPLELLQREEAMKAFDEVLKPREKEFLKLRFNDDLSFEDIGKRYGFSVEYTRQVIHCALRKIRKKLERKTPWEATNPHVEAAAI